VAEKINFDTVHRLLDELGFVQIPARESAVLFQHKASDTLLVFRPNKGGESIDPVTLSVVRKMLDEKGLLDRDEFDEVLHGTSLNGLAKTRRS
jgi:hypothetical protein